MTHPVSSNIRSDLPSATGLASSAAAISKLSTNGAQQMTLSGLQLLPVPPLDHCCFELPTESCFDMQRRRASTSESGKHFRIEAIYETPSVTREVVQNFLDDGRRPRTNADFRALSLFLLKNKLFSALAWLHMLPANRSLDLNSCNLGNEGVAMVAEWVASIPFQVGISLSCNQIDADGCVLLARGLASNSITTLDLSFNPLGDAGVELICAGLLQNSSLELLDLGNVNAGGSGIRAIAAILDTHPSLSDLTLDSNSLDDEAAAVFGAALGRNKTVSRLYMGYLNASDIGFTILLGAVKTNTKVRDMELSSSQFEQLHLSGALATTLAEVLFVNQTLKNLNLFAKLVSHADASIVAKAMEKNTTVQFLAFHWSVTDPEIAKLLKQITDKAKANTLIDDAGDALADLSRRPEWAVPVPSEVGRVIAAFIAHVGADERREGTMRAVIQAGPIG